MLIPKLILVCLMLLAILIVSYLPSNNDLQLTIKPQQLFKVKKPKGLIGQLNKTMTIIIILSFILILILN